MLPAAWLFVFVIGAFGQNAEDHEDAAEFRQLIKRNAFIDDPFPQNCDEPGAYSCIRFYPAFSASACNVLDCTYFLSYKRPSNINDQRTITFHLSSSNAEYVAVAFADNVNLDRADIVACVRNGNTIQVKHYFWQTVSPSISPENISVTAENLQLVDSAFDGEQMHCSVRRQLQSWDNRVKNLETGSYIQAHLWGRNDKYGKPMFLDDAENAKDWIQTFRRTLNVNLKVNEVVAAPILSSNVNCASNALSCVRYMLGRDWRLENCDYHTCTYQIAFTMGVTNEWPVFLSSKDADYVGVAMTTDNDNWRNAEVIGCKKTSNNNVVKFHQWVSNPKHGFIPQNISNGQLLELEEGRTSGSQIWCSFIRRHSDLPGYLSPSVPVYFLYFWGNVDKNGEVGEWPKQSLQMSDETINLSQGGSIKQYRRNSNSATSVARSSVLLHATLCTLIGMFLNNCL